MKGGRQAIPIKGFERRLRAGPAFVGMGRREATVENHSNVPR